MYVTSQLARAMLEPSKAHMAATKHLFRYLAGTTEFSITYKRGGLYPTAFSDANWGNNPNNDRSMSSYLMMMAKAPISFKAGLQTMTTMSAIQEELVAAAPAMKEIVFCSNMLTELGFEEEFKIAPLYIDNNSTLFVIGNRTYSARTKHVTLRFFCIPGLVKEGKVSIHHVPAQVPRADIGTKRLNKQRHQLINKIIGFRI